MGGKEKRQICGEHLTERGRGERFLRSGQSWRKMKKSKIRNKFRRFPRNAT